MKKTRGRKGVSDVIYGQENGRGKHLKRVETINKQTTELKIKKKTTDMTKRRRTN